MLYCSIDGQQQNLLSVKNRGFSYGDGLFTTAKIVTGKVEVLPQHLQRLVDGCEQLNIPAINFDELKQELEQVASSFAKAVIKVVITAGEGGRGYSRIGVGPATVIISVTTFPEHYDNWQQTGISLSVSKYQLGINPMLAGIKHLNRLEQVLIRQELDQRPEDDLLVTNITNHIIETSCANIFWLMGEQLYTPKIISSGVAGLMRAAVLTKRPDTIIKDFTLADIEQAQAMFICNSVMGIVPVKRFNGKLLTIDKISQFQSLL